MKPFFLSPEPSEAWQKSRKLLYWLWQYSWVVLSGVGVGLVSLFLATGPYALGLARGYFERPLILLMNLLIPVAFSLLFYGLTRRAHVGFLVNALLVLGFSAGNYFKLCFRDDPVMFADMLILREAGNMAGKYHLFLDKRLLLALLCVLAGWMFLFLLVPGKPGKLTWNRLCSALAGVLILAVGVPKMLDATVYHIKTAYYDRLNNRWAATQQYIAHGFLYPFVFSATEAFPTPPPGYNAAAAAQMLAAYEDAPIPGDKKVNVVGIMLEAFQDFSRFGVPELSRDIYAGYHELEAESYTGNLTVNIFAGGTVDSERAFLTGRSTLSNFRTRTNAYPWYFRTQGYQTTGMHPCFGWFYNRENINEYLGFESYDFVENRFAAIIGQQPAPDDVFFSELIHDLEERQSGAPIFSFSVTYQGHGPYASNPGWWSDLSDFFPADAPYTEEEMGAMANYFGGQENTIANLLRLRDWLSAQSEPYVLVLFGDHNPWMGDGNSIYKSMGLNFDQSTQEGFSNYYTTRYLIWANDAAKRTLGNDFLGEGPTVSPCFLMNQLFDLCSWKGPAYLQATRAVARRVPVQHTTGMYLENGVYTDKLTPEGEALSRDFSWLEYYRSHNFAYKDLS